MDAPTPPTDSELEVLKAFWRTGAMSAREAHAAVGDTLGWQSSTTRTVLERMRAKGLLGRKSVHGLAVYSAAGDKVSVLGGALKRLMRSVLEVRGELPASAFAGSQILSQDELDALHRMINAKPEDDQ
jgi:BlaI family penicillinase repressor